MDKHTHECCSSIDYDLEYKNSRIRREVGGWKAEKKFHVWSKWHWEYNGRVWAVNRDRSLLQYLDPLDCSKQVRGLGKRIGKDLKKEMGFTVLWIRYCLLWSYMSAHLWLCSLRVIIRPPLDTWWWFNYFIMVFFRSRFTICSASFIHYWTALSTGAKATRLIEEAVNIWWLSDDWQ